MKEVNIFSNILGLYNSEVIKDLPDLKKKCLFWEYLGKINIMYNHCTVKKDLTTTFSLWYHNLIWIFFIQLQCRTAVILKWLINVRWHIWRYFKGFCKIFIWLLQKIWYDCIIVLITVPYFLLRYYISVLIVLFSSKYCYPIDINIISFGTWWGLKLNSQLRVKLV